MVCRWVQNKAKLNTAYEKPGQSKKKSKLGCGRKPILSTIEDQLMEKVAHEREQQHHVSTKLVTVSAKNMAAEKGLTVFVGSRGWLCNFLKRFNLTLRRRTTTGQFMPHDLEDKLYSFVDINKKQRDLHKFEPSMITNMDETSIWADMPSATTIDRRGIQAVPIQTTGHEKNRLTVCLAVKADGTKMTPYVVIPAKKVKKSSRIYPVL